MFDDLIESRPRRARSLGQTLTAIALHGAAAALAVEATAGSATTVRDRRVDTTLVIFEPAPKEPAAPGRPRHETQGRPVHDGVALPAPPQTVPGDIPPIELDAEPLDPRAFVGMRSAGDAGLDTSFITDGPPQAVSGTVFLDAQLDDPVVPLVQPSPAYPPALRAAGVMGHVDLQFVVGADGRVEAGSVEVVASSHAAFEEPARTAVLRSTFRPARYRGQAVRQLVRQRVSFRVG